MVDMNTSDGVYKLFGAGNESAYEYIDRLLDRGADLSALAGEGAAAFNVGGALSSWVGNLVGGARNHVVILGDSNTQPEPANTWRWAQAIKADILTLSGMSDGGEGFRHLDLAEWSRVGDWFRSPPNGAIDWIPHGALFEAKNNGVQPMMTWTRPASFAAHDRVVMYSVDTDFIDIESEYSSNGGAFTPTAFNFGSGPGPRLVTHEVAVTITSTLRVRPSNAIFAGRFGGAAFYNGAAGLVVHNIAQGGNSVDTIAGSPTGGSNRLAILDQLTPKLTIIWTGTNEFHHAPALGIRQMTLERFYSQYTRIVERARQHGDVLMVFPQASQTPNTFQVYPWPNSQGEFERVARRVAFEQDAGYLSIRQMWGEYPRHAARGYASDSWHINQNGHAVVRKAIQRVLQRNS